MYKITADHEAVTPVYSKAITLVNLRAVTLVHRFTIFFCVCDKIETEEITRSPDKYTYTFSLKLP